MLWKVLLFMPPQLTVLGANCQKINTIAVFLPWNRETLIKSLQKNNLYNATLLITQTNSQWMWLSRIKQNSFWKYCAISISVWLMEKYANNHGQRRNIRTEGISLHLLRNYKTYVGQSYMRTTDLWPARCTRWYFWFQTTLYAEYSYANGLFRYYIYLLGTDFILILVNIRNNNKFIFSRPSFM